jgi:hypothetical protein
MWNMCHWWQEYTSGLQCLFNWHRLGSNMTCLFLYCQQHNIVISTCIYTTCEWVAIAAIVLPPNHSIISYGSTAMCDLTPLSPEHTCSCYPFSGLTFSSGHEVESSASAYHKTVLTSAVFIWAICRYSECTESRSLPYGRSVASSKAKANSQRLRSSASSFKYHYLFLALRSCSSRCVFIVFSALVFSSLTCFLRGQSHAGCGQSCYSYFYCM